MEQPVDPTPLVNHSAWEYGLSTGVLMAYHTRQLKERKPDVPKEN